MKLALVDYGHTELTKVTLDIVGAVLEEAGFDLDDVSYFHVTNRLQMREIKGFDLIVTFGFEALEPFCNVGLPLRKYAGCLTYNGGLRTWVLPTHHPNCIYGGKYGEFDDIYNHLRRAVALVRGDLELPPVGGHRVEWEFVGHNGERGYEGDEKVWGGYFESTEEEYDRQHEVLITWLNRLDSPDWDEQVTFGADTESYTTDHFLPMTMIQIYDPEWDKAFAFNWGVIDKDQDLWRRFLQHPNARFVWHNLKHDAKMLKHWLGVTLDERSTDTMCYALGLTEKGNQTGLKYLSRQFCNAPFY
ncbi:MAG: hypothetical protein LC723_14900, partial [Actinobacteria bacterium]|nr:hypothetical protein [Actinomycetota bacterium]